MLAIWRYEYVVHQAPTVFPNSVFYFFTLISGSGTRVYWDAGEIDGYERGERATAQQPGGSRETDHVVGKENPTRQRDQGCCRFWGTFKTLIKYSICKFLPSGAELLNFWLMFSFLTYFCFWINDCSEMYISIPEQRWK